MLGQLIAGGASLLGGLLSNSAAEDNQQRAYEQQRQLRQNAYQDTVGDLKSAGLNPMLAFGNGPTAAASAPPPAPVRNVMENAANSALAAGQAEQIEASSDLMRAQAEDVRAHIPVNATTATNLTKHTEKLGAEIDATRTGIGKMEHEIENIKSDKKRIEAQTVLNTAQSKLAEIQGKLAKGQIDLNKANEEYTKVLKELKDYEIPQGVARAEYWLSDMGRKQPYAEGVEKMGDAAGSVIGGAVGGVIKGAKEIFKGKKK